MQKLSVLALALMMVGLSHLAEARTPTETEHKTTKSCKIVFPSEEGRKLVKLEWTGACKGGYADGNGTTTVKWSNGDVKKSTVTFRKGRAEGPGSYEAILSNGEKVFFRGNYVNGTPNGSGDLTLESAYGDLLKYKGNFVDGMVEGQGRMETSKWEFTGHFRDMAPSGSGTMIFTNGDRLTAYFSNSISPSSGRIDYTNGAVYEGQLEKGLPNGKGRSTTPDGASYSGEFKAGQPDGKGFVQQRDGTRFPVSINNGVVTREKTQQEFAQDRYAAEARARDEQRQQQQQTAYDRAVAQCQARMANSVAPTNGNIGAMLAAAGQCQNNPGVQPPQPTVVVAPGPLNIMCNRVGAFINCQSF
jgi:hypothetical protein